MALEKILVVGTDSCTQQLARTFARHLFSADNVNAMWEVLETTQPNLIIFDPRLPHDNIRDSLTQLKERGVDIPTVVIGPADDKNSATELLNLGAFDCVMGNKEHARLGGIIDRIKCGGGSVGMRDAFFSEQCPSSVSIVGRSSATARVLKMIKLVAASSCNPVLIAGETGTGKELAARAVHILRHGSDKKFVAVNCAALTANLLESELFGHVRGAFTGADKDKIGLLELADSGTIFLDEISEMPLDLQAKLLRVIQEKIFRKVGGTGDIFCKATIITSSNRNLLKEVHSGRFRSDLYYRLTICPVILTPLRSEDRKEDISLLAQYFIRNSDICPEKKGKITGLTKLAQEKLLSYSWPGNVRELKNVLERAIILETSDKIGLSNLIFNPEQFSEDPAGSAEAGVKDFSLEKAEKELVKKALTEAGWQKTRAAALLGITRATLYAKVKQYNIKEPSENTPVLTG